MIVTSYFNPCGFQNLEKNLLRSMQRFQNLRCIELVYPGHTPVVGDIVVSGSEQNLWLWQKECLYELLPKGEPIIYLDCDLFFHEPDWEQKIYAALEQYDIVQGFRQCHWLDSKGRVEKTKQTVMAAEDFPNWPLTHPGFVWAFNPEAAKKLGWYKFHSTGGGDTALCLALFQKANFLHPLQDWERYFESAVGLKVGYADLEVSHIWHGSYKNRQYSSRIALTKGADDHIYLDHNGLLAWKNTAPVEVVSGFKYYFYGRKEDKDD